MFGKNKKKKGILGLEGQLILMLTTSKWKKQEKALLLKKLDFIKKLKKLKHKNLKR